MKNLLMTLLVFGLILTGTIQAKPNVKSYGPVKSGETLWRIAYKTRPRGISRLHMMRAIHKMNPDAFENGNINLLNKGVVLKIPRTRSLVRNVLSKESIAVDNTKNSKDQKDISALKNQLQKVKDELKASREQLKGLQALKKDETDSTPHALEASLTELKKVRSEVTALKQQNKRLLENSKKVDTSKVTAMEQELADTKDKLGALKVQNQLLIEASATADAKKEEGANNNNHQVSETIAALNADIGQLRSRIKELEEVEKLKDAHIAELKKSLDHASTVIKEQTEVNKKIFAQLNELKEAKNEREAQAATPPTVEKDTRETAVKPAKEEAPAKKDTSAVQPLSSSSADQTTADNNEPPVTQAIQHISPKFWLILTLAGLLLVLALLWKLVSVKHDDMV